MGQPGGIRSKITFWFCLIVTFMVGSSVITYGIVLKVEEKLLNIETVDVFLENTLKVRLIEKNFLLYGDQQSMEQWSLYLERLRAQLAENEELFVRLSSLAAVRKVQDALQDYNGTFSKFELARNSDEIKARIREQGNTLTVVAEELIVREHQTIHHLLGLIRNSLLLALPLIVVSFGSVAALLGKGIVFSLRQLEKHAAKIATGSFVEVQFSSTNREINSLINAFNRMSRELKTRQQQLVQAEKLASLGTMLAGVAHEFNNPLSNISSSAQILHEELGGKGNALTHELLDQISSETNRAAAIIKTLLSLARDENFHRDHYQLRPLVREIIDLLRGQVGKEVEIQLVVPAQLYVFVDKQKIQQVFINLLKNSLDALNGKGIIRIQAWQNEACINIALSDDGPGIPGKVKEKIFDPFFTTKDTGQGSGLGLFIVHDIIVQHGGTIAIDNINGKGAVFMISLPLKEM